MKAEKKKMKKIEFPKDFFNISRPTINNKKTFKNIIPIKWEQKSKEILVNSKKENELL